MSNLNAILECARAEWSPGLGDPHLMGWVTVAVYAICAIAALRLSLRSVEHDPMDLRERLFWGGIGSVLALLAVNKQLDLQTLLTVLGRCHAIVEGWYDTRQAVQRAFIRSVAVGAAILLLGLSWFLRDSLRRNFLALCGFAFVLGFVVIRAVGFHDVDQLIGAEWKSVRMNWVLELTGLLLILMAALPRLRRG